MSIKIPSPVLARLQVMLTSGATMEDAAKALEIEFGADGEPVPQGFAARANRLRTLSEDLREQVTAALNMESISDHPEIAGAMDLIAQKAGAVIREIDIIDEPCDDVANTSEETKSRRSRNAAPAPKIKAASKKPSARKQSAAQSKPPLPVTRPPAEDAPEASEKAAEEAEQKPATKPAEPQPEPKATHSEAPSESRPAPQLTPSDDTFASPGKLERKAPATVEKPDPHTPDAVTSDPGTSPVPRQLQAKTTTAKPDELKPGDTKKKPANRYQKNSGSELDDKIAAAMSQIHVIASQHDQDGDRLSAVD